MKKLFVSVLIPFLYTVNLQAQILKGSVLDKLTNQPVEFASIGVLHREAGTVADEKGNFTFHIQNVKAVDTIKISMLGYESQQYLVAHFDGLLKQNNGIIVLQPKTQNLQEVVIKPRKTKTLLAGNTTNSRFISAGFGSNDLGSEVGTVLRYSKKKPGRIENVNFNIAYNTFDNVLFRVNVYDFKNGKVGENLLKEPLYLETSMDSGTLTLDLSEKNIYIFNDCLLTLEWIKDFGKKGLMFSAGFLNSDSYSRKISQGDWSKVPAGLGFWAEIMYEK
jgi:hypothetical protein